MLKPNLHITSVYDIDTKKLKEKNIHSLIFDLDNTLVSEETEIPTEEIKNFLNHLKKNGISVGVVSNNKKERVKKFMEPLGVPYFYKAGKPSTEKVKEMMKILGTDNKTTAMVGDRLTTDVLVGKRAEMYTILVNPIGKDLDFKVKCVRKVEKIFLAVLNCL